MLPPNTVIIETGEPESIAIYALILIATQAPIAAPALASAGQSH